MLANKANDNNRGRAFLTFYWNTVNLNAIPSSKALLLRLMEWPLRQNQHPLGRKMHELQPGLSYNKTEVATSLETIVAAA